MCDNRNKFCCICGLFTDIGHRRVFNSNFVVVQIYNKVFKRSYDKSRWYEPEVVCEYCCSALKKWNAQSTVTLPFSVPMTWHHQPYHKKRDCYFCQTNVSGYTYKSRKLIEYANVTTVTKPVNFCKDKSIFMEEVPTEINISDEAEMDIEDDVFLPPDSERWERHLVSNADFADLVRDLHLSKRETETLGSRLKQWKLVDKSFQVTSERNSSRITLIKECFKTNETDSDLVYCANIPKLFLALNHNYNANEWRLFIDGSCKSLKAVLLHNENQLPSVPIAYGTHIKETYEVMEKIFRLVDYATHKWKVVADLKVLTILFGMQGGYTKYPCYLCEWDSRAQHHYNCKTWPPRESHQIGKKNALNLPLVKAENVILPPLHLKLGYMKQFVKRLDVNGEAFCHLKTVFPRLSEAKIKAGVFIGPQISKVMKDLEFINKLSSVEKRAWKSFKELCSNFLGNHKSENYEEIVKEFLDAYAEMGCNMSIKVHFLHSHLNFFPENLGQFSDEQGEHFHQEIALMETRFEGKNKINLVSEYCWSLLRETDDVDIRKKRSSKHFTA